MTLIEALEEYLVHVIGDDAARKVSPALARKVYAWMLTYEGRHACRTIMLSGPPVDPE